MHVPADARGRSDLLDALQAPEPYAPLWPVIGLALVVLIAGWYVFIWLYTRARRRPAAEHRDDVAAPAARHAYRAAIDDLERQCLAGSVATREAHRRLSALVRDFAGQAGHDGAASMTLTELRAELVGPRQQLAAAVALAYPGQFRPDMPDGGDGAGAGGAGAGASGIDDRRADFAAAAEAAREVIVSWS